MKIKQMAERLNSVPVRKKAKQILAVTLAVLMANPVTGYGVSAHAQEAETITAFAKLSSEIATQQLAVSAEESDISLPDTLSVTLSVYGADTTESIVEDSKPEEIPTEEAKPDENTLKEPAADESPAEDFTVSDNDAEEPQEDANAAEDNTDADTKPAEVVQITSEERTLTDITWQINAERSGLDTFDSARAGAVFFYEPVLPQGYTLADGVSLPQIQVQIEQNDQWAFSQSQTIDGTRITVKAKKDVFPEGAVLHAEKVISAEDKEKIQSAVSEEVKAENSAKTVTKLVSFDIIITDTNGNELQPDTGKGEVKVSFAQLPMVTEDTTPTQELKVFHMDDTLSTAKKLDTTVNQEAKSVEATAEHFSLYTVALLTAKAEDGEASVTDSVGTITYYNTIEEAITAAQGMSGSTVILLKDSQTEALIEIASGSFTLDLNGKTITYTDASGRGTTAIEMTGSASLTVRDSAENGGIIATNARYAIDVGDSCKLTLYAGRYTGIQCFPLVSAALADGMDFESLENANEWTSRETIAKLNLNKVTNVRVGRMPADIEVSEQGGGTHYYDNIGDAIAGAISYEGSTLKMNKDVSLNNELNITGGKFSFDLNGHTLTFADGMQNLMVQSGADVTFKDSVGTGKISNSAKYAPTLYIFNGGNVKISGGSYENRNSEGKAITLGDTRTVGDVLANGYIYRSLSDNSYISNISSHEIGSVKVVPSPVKITNQPQDVVVQPDYSELPKFALEAHNTGADNFTCQWYSVGTGAGGTDEVMSDETTPMLVIETGKPSGEYKYYCELTCADYKVKTKTVTLSVLYATGPAQLEESGGTITAYTTIEKAIDAAKTKLGSTVKLVEDVSTAETIELSEGNFTIDLNGHTWTAAKIALSLKSGSNITLKDSGTGGTIRSSQSLLNIETTSLSTTAMLTIESGIYKYTGGGSGNIVNSNNELYAPQNGAVINILGGEFSCADASSGYLAYFVNATVNISGGSFINQDVYFSQVNAQLSGGEFKSITNQGGNVAALLKTGYGFRTIDNASSANGKWVNQIEGAQSHDNDLAHEALSYKTRVEQLPLEINTQPANPENAVYGYTSEKAPKVSMLAEKTAATVPGGDAPKYRLWRVKSGEETLDIPVSEETYSNRISLPTGLSAGEHRFYMTAECDGAILRSNTVTFHVEKATPTISLKVVTREEAPFVYGEEIYFRAEVNGINGEKPNGTVTFKMDGKDLKEVNEISYGLYQTGDGDIVDAGSHSFTAVYTPSTDGIGKNYVGVTSTAVEKAIAKANQKAFAINEVTGKKYGDAPFTLENTGGSGTGKVTFLVPENNGVLSISGDTATIIGAGTVVVTANKAEDSNYHAATATQSITINKATPTITINEIAYNNTKSYDGKAIANPTAEQVTVTGGSYEDIDFLYSSQMSGPFIEQAPKDAGYEYYVQARILGTENTNLCFSQPKKFDIIKCMLNVTGGTAASKKYDGTTNATVTELTFNGLQNGETLAVRTDYTVGSPVYDNAAVGTEKRINGTVTLVENAKTKNYYFMWGGNRYTITNGVITLGDGPAAPANGVVDDVNNTFTFDSTNGTVYEYKIGADNWADITASGTTTAIMVGNKALAVGELQVRIKETATHQAGAVLTNATAFTASLEGIVSITGTAAYGETLTAAVTGQQSNAVLSYQWMANGEAISDATASTFAIPGSLVGKIITVEATATNYSGKLTSTTTKSVDKKAVTATADTVTKVYDGTVEVTVPLSISKVNASDEITITANASYDSADAGTGKSITLGSLTITGTAADWYDVSAPTAGATGTITAKPLTTAIVTVNGSYIYTGSAIVPTADHVFVKDGTTTFTNGTDYTFTASNNINAGEATVMISFKGNYSGTVTGTFTIVPKPITPTIEPISAMTFTGTQLMPVPMVNDGTTTLTKDSDYTVSYGTNINAGADAGSITVTLKGNYIGESTSNFTITKALAPTVAVPSNISMVKGQVREYSFDLSTLSMPQNAGTKAYAVASPSDTSLFTVNPAVEGSILEFTSANIAAAGGTATAVVTITSGNYEDTIVTLTFEIVNKAPVTISGVTVADQAYIGMAVAMSGTPVASNGTSIVTVTGYDYAWSKADGTPLTEAPKNAGDYKLTISVKANDPAYVGSVDVPFRINKAAVTVKADDKSILVGSEKPDYTATTTGLVNSETMSDVTFADNATDTTTKGSYIITPSGGTISGGNDNYRITYESGTLIINIDVSSIDSAIAAANTAKNGISVDDRAASQVPSGTKFVTTAEMNALTAAIRTATAAKATVNTAGEAQASAKTLDDAVASFKAAIKTGTYTAPSGGGGSSGGGTSLGGNTTTTTAPVATQEKMPNQPVMATAPVTATAGKNGMASASIPDKAVTNAIAKAKADAKAQGKTANGITVALDVTMPKGTASLTATLTRSSLDSLVSAGVSSLEINGTLVQVSFDKKALAEIQKQSTGNISIAIAPKTNLSTAAKKMIGTRPVYDITVGYGRGKNVSSFKGGIATISIPYTLGKNEAVGGLYAVYVNKKGKATRIAGSAYDANSGCVIFTTTHFSQYGIGYTAPASKFTDISTHWAKESIDYVVSRRLLSGSSKTAFSPNSAITRGMLVTALGRLAGVDTKAYTKNSFTDVKADSAYRPYIEWAYSKGIMQGIGGNQFAPDSAITREEIAVIFANYAKATGYTLPITREAIVYADASSIGSAYKDAVKALQQAGIMMGSSDNKFNPKGNATRAEVSSMLGRYIKLTINPATAQGWAQNDAGQYLYYKDGLMASGKWLEIDGKWYYFYTDGSLARNTKIDGYEVDKNGVRKTK